MALPIQESYAGCMTGILQRTLAGGERLGLTRGTEVYVIGRRPPRDLIVATKAAVDNWIRMGVVDETDVRFTSV